MPEREKKFHLLVLGCQMNQSDAERVGSFLVNLGYSEIASEKEADLIVVVACSIRKSAVDRMAGKAHNWQRRRKQGDLKIVLTGCVLEEDKKKLAHLFDAILPIAEISGIAEVIGLGKAFDAGNDYSCLPASRANDFSALVPIMNGCNNFCSYCVVPYVRGREVSRPAESIIEECRNLIKSGTKEIILLGQNVNSYRYGGYDFPRLLSEIDSMEGDFWLRFFTSHPKDLSDDLIDAMSGGEHVAPHLHLALQSGDKDILEAMNRRYTPERFLQLIGGAREKISGLSLSTDIIVGFPGETEGQFRSTVDLMLDAKFDMAYISKYSPRSGTAAAKLKDDISSAEKDRREEVLNDILKITALENNKRYLKKNVDVLVDGWKNGLCYGKTAAFKTVSFVGEKSLIGSKTLVKIEDVEFWSMRGSIIQA